MEDNAEKESVWLSGRLFTNEELRDVKYIVRRFGHLTRNELAKTICEGLSWETHKGEYKLNSCLEFLERLEAKGVIKLPKKRITKPAVREVVLVGQHTESEPEIRGRVSDLGRIELESVRSQADMRLWNEYVERYHYLGYKRPFGAHQRYFMRSNSLNRRLGCLLFASSAWALSERDAWIGWNKEERSQRLPYIVNNTRFLIFPWVEVKNLASKVLSVAARQIPADWQERYGITPVLLETFVDVSRYRGTSYQAANWIDLGETTGRGRMDRYHQALSSPKRIYMYPLRQDFRVILCGKGREAE